jgi:hypothetical protein
MPTKDSALLLAIAAKMCSFIFAQYVERDIVSCMMANEWNLKSAKEIRDCKQMMWP